MFFRFSPIRKSRDGIEPIRKSLYSQQDLEARRLPGSTSDPDSSIRPCADVVVDLEVEPERASEDDRQAAEGAELGRGLDGRSRAARRGRLSK